MAKIDFKAKTNRELLILAVQAINNIDDHLAKLNNTVAKHEQAITILNTRYTTKCEVTSKYANVKAKWQFKIGIVSLLCGVVFGVGKACGWW